MTDRLLTNDALAAIAARADGVLARTAVVEAFAELATGLAADIPALLAHIRAQDAEIDLMKRKTDRYVEESMTILVEAEAEWKAKHDAQGAALARLRDALAALVDAAAHGIPGGYIGVYPDETDRYCTYCFTSWRMGEPERHDDDCPVAAALALLSSA